MKNEIICLLTGPDNLKGPYPPGYMRSLGYLHWHEVAEYRYKHGDRQLHCGTCGWVWPEECNHEGKKTQKEYDALVRKIIKFVNKYYPSAESRYRPEVAKARREGKLPNV